MSQDIIIWKKGSGMKRSYKRDKASHYSEKANVLVGGCKSENSSDFLEFEKIQESISEISYNRELVGNRKINPFMKDNNYVNDLGIQDKFLRPQNCNKNISLSSKKPLEYTTLVYENKKN